MIRVKPSPTADTRTCDPEKVTRDQLLESSKMHIDDVLNALCFLSNTIVARGNMHDHDKISDIDGFKRDFTGGNFVERDWYQNHIRVNRHHLAAEGGVPEDVNLIDVLEMLADGAVAGMARSGSVYQWTSPMSCCRKR